jgi:hypothetical protein
LIHLTNPKGKVGINETGELRGSHGIYGVPEKAATEGTPMRVIRTGLPPSQPTQQVPIPDAALGNFKRPVPIGPYSAWKYFGGVWYARPGSINMTTGVLTPSSSLIGPGVLIYGPDVLFYVVVGTAIGSAGYLYYWAAH